jgi:molybdopterin-guanine dinucleotide biosynthesis protein A
MAAGYVLVGGHSSRFGTDKALAEWNGQPLALRVAEHVRAAAGSVTLVGNPEKYRHLGLPTIADPVEGCGPLAGLAAALQHSGADYNLVVACDMPRLRPEFLQFLLRVAEGEAADVVMPLDREGREEPLCAVYARRCRGPVAAALHCGVRKLTAAFSGLRVRRVPFSEYCDLDPDGTLFANLNTPAEWAAANVHG